jgi:hypothetical protein
MTGYFPLFPLVSRPGYYHCSVVEHFKTNRIKCAAGVLSPIRRNVLTPWHAVPPTPQHSDNPRKRKFNLRFERKYLPLEPEEKPLLLTPASLKNVSAMKVYRLNALVWLLPTLVILLAGCAAIANNSGLLFAQFTSMEQSTARETP